jgi:phosphate-selective porin OprO/OprP
LIRILIACVGLMAAGLPAAAQTPAPPPETKVDASRGGITISSGVNSLTIGARMQFRWTLDDREAFDADIIGEGVGRADGPSSAFDVPRMRISFSGGAFRPWLKYEFQFDLSRTSGESGSKIKDAVIEIRPVDHNYRVLFGQFKAPFGLQQLTSSGRQQFVDRAITDNKFVPSRDMGVMVRSTFAGGTIGVDAGIFNGAGESRRQNNRSHLLTGRVYYQPWGAYRLSEGSSDAGDDAVLHVGAGIRTGTQVQGRTASGVFDDADNQTAMNAEFAYKARRLFATAEYFWMSDAQENPVDARDIDSRGFHAQASYMLVPRIIEAGVRYARIDPDTDVSSSDVTEIRGVVGYYWQGHNLKVQGDVGQVGFDDGFSALASRARQGLPSLGTRLVTGERVRDTQLRVQLQIAF